MKISDGFFIGKGLVVSIHASRLCNYIAFSDYPCEISSRCYLSNKTFSILSRDFKFS